MTFALRIANFLYLFYLIIKLSQDVQKGLEITKVIELCQDLSEIHISTEIIAIHICV